MSFIVHLTSYYSPHGGGVEKHVERLNQELVKRGHQVTVITKKHEAALQEKEAIRSVTVLRIPIHHIEKNTVIKKTRYKLSIWKGIYQHFNLLKCANVIHIHDVFFWLIPFLPFLSRKKLFITFHGYEGNSLPSSMRRFWHQVAARFTHKNICIGSFHQKWYGVTPDSISFGAIGHQQKNAKKIRKNKIIFAGRIEEDNGLLLYLEAIHQLQKKGKIYHLDVFGEGSQEKLCKEYVSRHKLDVAFHGFVPDVSTRFENYEYAFVSRYLSILEALASEICVIAQCTNELTKDYLMLAPFANSISMCQTAEEIAIAINHPTQTTEQTRQWIHQQTWPHLADTYEELWKHAKN